MSLNRNEKAAVVADVSTQVARSQTLALAEYRGLTVAHLDTLRRQARDKGVYLHVLKNTLARRAVAGTPFEVAQETMVGPLIYGFSEDAVAAAKVMADFAKSNDKLVVKGGAYAGKVLDANGVKALAAIPTQGSAAGPTARPDAVADLAPGAGGGGDCREEGVRPPKPQPRRWPKRRPRPEPERRQLTTATFDQRNPKWHSIKTHS